MKLDQEDIDAIAAVVSKRVRNEILKFIWAFLIYWFFVKYVFPYLWP
jgi:hypothetical protein